MISCIAFDCFGTIFKMNNVPAVELRAYVNHVRQNDFSPFHFGYNWQCLEAHPDAILGIRELRALGYICVTLSNGDVSLLSQLSSQNGIFFDRFINLAAARVYKPNLDAYRQVEKQLGYAPSETLLVTANPKFGDIEGAAAVGMRSQVIRQPGGLRDVLDLADKLGSRWNQNEI